MRARRLLAALAVVASVAPAAVADDSPGVATDIDVDRSELLDVIATKDGSIWKGVLVEQTPGVDYKLLLSGGSLHVLRAEDVVSIRKERNPKFHAAPAPRAEVVQSGPGRASTGLVLGAGLTLAIPAGDLKKDDGSTVSPGFGLRGGYRYRSDNLSAQLGGLARFIYWNVPGSPDQAYLWTLEMFAFVRAGLRGTKFEPYVELSLGPEATGYDVSGLGEGGGVAFAATLTAGVALIATRSIDVELDVTYHPPLSPVPYANDDFKISYFGLRLAGSFHH
jgi:hypothetical protein